MMKKWILILLAILCLVAGFLHTEIYEQWLDFKVSRWVEKVQLNAPLSSAVKSAPNYSAESSLITKPPPGSPAILHKLLRISGGFVAAIPYRAGFPSGTGRMKDDLVIGKPLIVVVHDKNDSEAFALAALEIERTQSTWQTDELLRLLSYVRNP